MDILSNVQQFTPTFLNIDNSSLLASHAAMIQGVDEKNEQANKALMELKTAIGQMDLNENDEYIKKELYDNIRKTVENNSTILGMGTAYNSILQEIGNVAINPKVVAALENQKRNKENIDAINKMDLDADMKEMYLELTKYNGIKENDINIDEEGNILSIKKWKPDIQPTKQININEMLLTALKYMNPDTTGTSGTIFYDSNNNITTDMTKAAYYINSQHQKEELTRDKIVDAITTTILANSQYLASLKQDYIRSGWYLNKYNTDDYGYKNPDGSNRTFEEYLQFVLDPAINSIQYVKDINQNTPNIIKDRFTGIGGSITESVDRIIKNIPTQISGIVEITEDRGQVTKANSEAADNAIVDTYKTIYKDVSQTSIINKLKENGLDISQYNKFKDIPEYLLTPENLYCLQLLGFPVE